MSGLLARSIVLSLSVSLALAAPLAQIAAALERPAGFAPLYGAPEPLAATSDGWVPTPIAPVGVEVTADPGSGIDGAAVELIDGTPRGLVAQKPVRIELRLGQPQEIAQLTAWGAGTLRAHAVRGSDGRLEALPGAEAVSLRGGWQRVELARAVVTDRVLVDWEPQGDAPLSELALWGRASASAVSVFGEHDASRLVLGLPVDAVAVAAQRVSENGYRFELPQTLRPFGSAFLRYRLKGRSHWTQVPHELNGRSSALASPVRSALRATDTVQVEPLALGALRPWQNALTFEAAAPGAEYRIEDVSVVLLPHGRTREVAIPDGSLRTKLAFPTGTQAHQAVVHVQHAGSGALAVFADAEPKPRKTIDLSGLRTGWHRIDLDADVGPARELWFAREPAELRVDAGARAMLSALYLTSSVAEELPSSLAISHPLHGECTAAGQEIRGHAAAGLLESVRIAGHEPFAVAPDGSFRLPLAKRSAGSARVEGVFAGGATSTVDVRLDSCEAAAQRGLEPDWDAPYSAQLRAAEGGVLEFGGARLEVPAGALEGDTRISIRPLHSKQLLALEEDKTNTTPGRGGFRFGPHGLKFAKPVLLTLPYDRAAMPEEARETEVFAFFYDEKEARWSRVARAADARDGRLPSVTDHFTDFVTATLALPEAPGPRSYSPGDMNDVELADPAEGIPLIAPPESGAFGGAQLGHPIQVPPGRNGLQPDLAFGYSSERGNGWLGVGWDLAPSSIEVDTKFGVPCYGLTPCADEAGGPEDKVYVLDGEEIIPAPDGYFASRPLLESQNPDAVDFVRRSEGPFDRIERVGASRPYHWVVTDKRGTRFIYGETGAARLGDPNESADPNQRPSVFRWNLERVADVFGNEVRYEYQRDEGCLQQLDARPAAPLCDENFTSLYLRAITYTHHATAGAPYRVSFELGNQVRPDQVLNARAGFVEAIRHRLVGVQVEYRPTLASSYVPIRRYALQYHEGDFAKSLLSSISLQGPSDIPADAATRLDETLAPPHFVQHAMEYHQTKTPNQQTYEVFAEPANGPPPPQPGPYQPQTWGTAAGHTALSTNSSSSEGINAHAGIGIGPVNLTAGGGGDQGRDTVQSRFVDIHGDALPDFIDNGGQFNRNVLVPASIAPGDFFSQIDLDARRTGGFDALIPGHGAGSRDLGFTTRTGWSISGGLSVFGITGSAAHSRSTATDERAMVDINGDGFVDLVSVDGEVSVRLNDGHGVFGGVQTWGELSAADIDYSQDDLVANGANAHLVDPLVRWVAPHSGLVDISGPIRKLAAGGDGFTARIHALGGIPLDWHRDFGPNDLVACTPSPTDGVCGSGINSFFVQAGQSILFDLSARHDPSLPPSFGDAVADDVSWEPSIAYQSTTGVLEPYGRPAEIFDFVSDFRTGGLATSGWTARAQGTVVIEGTFDKLSTNDDVTLTVERRTSNDIVYPFPFSNREVIAANATGSIVPPGIAAMIIPVDAGDRLVMRVSTHAPIDPARAVWRPTVRYLTYGRIDPLSGNVVVGNVSCSGDECTTHNDPTPSVPIPREDIERQVLAPVSTFHFEPYAPTRSFSGPLFGTFTGTVNFPATMTSDELERSAILVQGVHTLFAKRVPTTTGSTSVNVVLPGTGPFFFTVVSPVAIPLANVTDGASVVNIRTLDPSSHTPSLGLFGNPLTPGFHQWQFGEFNGDRDITTELLSTFGQQPYSGVSAYDPAIAGEISSQGSTSPAWLLRGGGLISRDVWSPARAAHMLAGVRGGRIQAIRIGDTWNNDFNFGVIIGGIGYSYGKSTTELDLLDINGDRLPDSVTYGRVRYSQAGGQGFATSSASVPMGLAGKDVLREVGHSTGRFEGHFPNVGGSDSSELKNETNTRGQTTQLIATQFRAGVDYGISSTNVDLVDMNGDGLLDQVKRSGDDHFTVRLGLGYRFSEPITWPIGKWDPGFDTKPGNTPAGIINDVLNATGAVGKVPDVVRVEDTGAHNIGVGGGFVVEGGGGLTFTMNRTLVDLIDINGDGLPDAVMKIPTEDRLRVRLNLGSRFGAEQEWHVPAWGTGDLSWDSNIPFNLDASLGNADTLGFRRSQGTSYNVGFSFCIILCFGVNGYRADSHGAESLGFEDIDGDGLLDHVLKQKGSTPVRAKLNQLGKANLLLHVDRPLGSSFDLDYRRRGNRVDDSVATAKVDMPSSQHVLAATRVDDGRGNVYTEVHDYEGGFYDRDERLRYGFATVRTTRLADASEAQLDFYNQDYYRKGRVRHSTEREIAGGFVYGEQDYAYAEPIGLDPRTGIFFAPETVRQLTTHEKADPSVTWQSLPGGTISTIEGRNFDEYGDLRVYTLQSDLTDPNDDLTYHLDYQRSGAPYFSRPNSIFATSPSAAAPLREGRVVYDGRGAITSSTAVIYGGKDSTGAVYSGALATSGYTVNAHGNLESMVDPGGYTLTFDYDDEYQLFRTATTDSFGYESSAVPDYRFGTPAAITDVNGHFTIYEYDEYGRPTAIVDPRGLADGTQTIRFVYSEQGSDALPRPFPAWAKTLHRDELLTSGGDERDPITTVRFVDGLGRLIQTKKDAARDFAAGSPPVVGMTVSGHVVFDARGRIAETGQPVFEAVTGAASHLPGSSSETYTDGPPLRPTLMEYDTLGRLVRVDAPDGTVTQSSYTAGRLDGVDRLVIVGRDALNRERLLYRDVDGSAVGVIERNVIGAVRVPLTTRYGYDALSQLTRIEDPRGNVTTAAYDSRGLRVALTSPDAGLTEWSYSRPGNLVVKQTAKLRAANQSIRYAYDFNRLSRIVYPDTDPAVMDYGAFDEAGAAEGNLAGRLKLETSEAGDRTFTYDELGNPVRVEMSFQRIKDDWLPNYDQELTYEHDSFGRLLSVQFPGTGKERVSYDYDAGGKIRSILGQDTEYTSPFDHDLDQTAYLTHMGYDEFGSRVRVVYGNGVTTSLSYDDETRRLATVASDYRVDSWFGGSQPKPFQRLEYDYDLVGNLSAIRNELPIQSSLFATVSTGATDQTFQYDELNQLVRADGVYQEHDDWRKQYSLTFEYDQIGNITRKDQTSEKWTRSLWTGTWSKYYTYKDETYVSSYVYGGTRPHAPSRLDKTSPAYATARKQDFVYDGSGNQESWIERETLFNSEKGRREITWTSENRIRKVKEGLITKSKALYDGDETRRVHYQYAFDEIAYLDEHLTIRNGVHLTKHVYAGDIRIASKGGVHSHDKPLYYHPDHLGSVHYVSDSHEDLVEHAEYYPSGELWLDGKCNTLDGPPTYLFNGKEYEQSTALYAYGARHYDARQSQWLSPDPALAALMDTDQTRGVWQPINLALYGYARNNPVRYGDPSGAIPIDTIWDAASIAYDLGKIGVGYATSNPALVAEGAVDLAADTAALLIPYVPAGAGKLVRLAAQHGDEAVDVVKNLDKANDARKAVAKAEGAGSAAGKGPKGSSGSPKADGGGGGSASGGGGSAGGGGGSAGGGGGSTGGGSGGVSKNSRKYQGPTDVYAIRGPDGKVQKIGESATGRDAVGRSRRAEWQVRKLNRKVGPGHTSEIRKSFPNKDAARTYETKVIERFRRLYGDDALPLNKTNR